MMPTIETIVEDVMIGTISKPQAVGLLHQHAADACRTLRDDFAAAAIGSIVRLNTEITKRQKTFFPTPEMAKAAYEIADAMLLERTKST